jgi:1-acyl-sn-glycerol-3-phosphate acyltransferase
MSVALRRPARSEIRPAHAAEPLYRSVIGLALATFRVMDWKVFIEGSENVPLDGPAVIASNHLSHLDFLFVGLAAYQRRRLVRFMAIRSAFDHPVSGPLLRGMHHIPVDREHDPARALDASIEALRHGEVVGLHPEGQIRRSLIRPQGKTGAVRMSLESGAPLIPAAVWGTQPFFRPKGRPRFPRHAVVSVRLGQALELHPRMSLSESTALLLERIDELEAQCGSPRAAPPDQEQQLRARASQLTWTR